MLTNMSYQNGHVELAQSSSSMYIVMVIDCALSVADFLIIELKSLSDPK